MIAGLLLDGIVDEFGLPIPRLFIEKISLRSTNAGAYCDLRRS